MKKNWILPIVAIFIAANVATYLFVQGRVKIVEKVVTIYKDAKDALVPEKSGKIDTIENKVNQALSLKTTRKPEIDFNDTDYLIESTESSALSSPDTPKTDTKIDSASSTEEKTKPVLTSAPNKDNSDNNLANTQTESSYSSNTPSQVAADENIPMPQLPLIDSDFENDTDTVISNGIQLPQLPDIS